MTEPPDTEPLETGWGADTPVVDTVLRRFVTGYGEWLENSGRRAGHPTLRTDDVIAVDESSAHLLLNHAVLLRPLDDPTRAEALAADLQGFFGARDGGAFSVFNPWPGFRSGTEPGSVPPGFAVGGYPPFMLRAPGGERPAAPPDLELVEVDHADLLAEYERVLVEGFPLESLQPWQRGVALHESIVGAPGMRCFIGRVEGRAVTAATSIVNHGLNHVEWVATQPDARGRGYGAAVTWQATLADPTLPAALIATDMGRPVYERMGYLPLFRWAFLMANR